MKATGLPCLGKGDQGDHCVEHEVVSWHYYSGQSWPTNENDEAAKNMILDDLRPASQSVIAHNIEI